MDLKNGIFIDLGHGGHDSGALGLKYSESMLVLDIGKELNLLLEESGLKYQFSRLSDIYLTLDKRCELANKMKADIFISIHINSAKDTSVAGTESWVYSLNNNKTSVDFATSITNELSDVLEINNRGVKENSRFRVLNGTTMGAIIIEVDFISNPNREQAIKDNIKVIAKTIYINILKFYEMQDSIEERLYKVNIGAFKNKENAVKLKNEAIAKGFKDTYII